MDSFEERLFTILADNVKYDESSEPIEVCCSECGKPTGEYTKRHAQDCPCMECKMFRRFVQRSTGAGKKVEFRKISGIS